jgi:hypothetical protein
MRLISAGLMTGLIANERWRRELPFPLYRWVAHNRGVCDVCEASAMRTVLKCCLREAWSFQRPEALMGYALRWLSMLSYWYWI